ncbi:MAG: hypothetical protein A3A97_01980 [Candidatus Terrybacteria bacterium RIFCSPLOWO2_01_FULL_40_23]|uniref:DUF5666 domain-containing protein n=1 Tax=Candidatus Terrybacteria bacterium RIFCSPLOWO2_01_FULL_40_23 TaxID=1802366 RepID=A0A1G2PQP1_9BACT|nr:MAG: hypothetical protein A3A97_01980 [Candidatus Terrybacteria bacterium RIFCSPLOWO2_01_FULL_40_23]
MQHMLFNKMFQLTLSALIVGASVGFAVTHITVVDEIAALNAEIAAEKDALAVESEVLENKIFSEWRATVTGNILSLDEKNITVDSESNKGSQVIVYLSPDTHYRDARNAPSPAQTRQLQDLKVGDRIAVLVMFIDGKPVANAVTIEPKLSTL